MSAEHAARWQHRSQPRPHVTHWGTDGSLHDGVDPASCPTCDGSGEVSPNPHAASTPALILTECPDCCGSGERSAS